MKNAALIFGLLVVVGLAFVSSVFAQAPNSSKANRVAADCQKVTAALNGRTTSAAARIAARNAYVARRKSQVQDRIQKLQARGADTTKLSADAMQYATLLDKWLADYKTYIVDLQSAQNINCDTARAQFKVALQTARNAHTVVNQDRTAVQNSFNTLNSDFKSAVQSVKNMKGNK